MAELAFRKHQAGEKRADRHRQSDLRTEPCGADTGHEDGERERLAAPAGGHEPKQCGQHQAAATCHGGDGQEGLAKGHRYRGQRRFPGQHRHEQQEEDDRQVLQEEYADRHAAMWRGQFIPLGEPLEDDGCARERNEETDEERESKRNLQRQRKHHGDDGSGAGDLQRACGEDGAPDLPHGRQRKIQPDGEEQQDDADLREHLDFLGRLDHSDAAGPGHDARDHHCHDARDAQAGERDDESQGNGVGDDEIGQQRMVGHSLLMLLRADVLTC